MVGTGVPPTYISSGERRGRVESMVEMSQEQGAAASGAGSMVERTPAHVLRALSEAARSVMHAFRLRPDGTACFSFADPRIFDVYGLKPDVVAADATPIMQRIHPDDLAML